MSEGPGPGKKRLKDLRVTDLKNQLEKRGLATSGVKAVLLERLQKQLEEEGINVEEFDFGAPTETTAMDDATKETETPQDKKVVVNGNETGQEEDAIHLMIEDEENLFDEEEGSAAVPASPPRPETAPVIQPFTSSDTISLSSRNKAPSENSSMLVNPDESESVGSSKSLREQESPLNGDPAEEEGNKRGRNLWVSGLASSYRATDLKKVFSAHGKVIGAKVVTNTRIPGARCYGYVTMGTYDEASECIKHLNKTELHNRVITVERAKSGESGPPKKEEEGNSNASSQEKDNTEEKEISDESKSTEEPKRTSNTRESPPTQRGRSRSPYRGRKPRYNNHHRFRRLAPGDARNKIRDISPRREDRASRPGVLTVSQIREQREKEVDDARRWRERAREAEESRRLRDREIRRLEDAEYRREMERRRRSEEERFERERLELRREREKIEREKAELLKLERERQRFERERLQREKEELERLRWEQSRIEDTRRAMKRPAVPSHEHQHHNPIRGSHDGGNRMKRAPLPVPNDHHNNHHQMRGNSSDGGFYDDRKRDISGSGIPMPTQRYNNPTYSNSSNRGYDRPRYESSRGGFSGGRREDYRGGDRGSSNGNRHFSSPWDSSTSGGSTKSNYMMGSGSEWNSRPQNSSQSVIPRPPILSGISMGSSSSGGGVNSYSSNMGSNNGYNNGGFGANSHNQQQQHRYDNYKNNMGPKRHY